MLVFCCIKHIKTVDVFGHNWSSSEVFLHSCHTDIIDDFNMTISDTVLCNLKSEKVKVHQSSFQSIHYPPDNELSQNGYSGVFLSRGVQNVSDPEWSDTDISAPPHSINKLGVKPLSMIVESPKPAGRNELETLLDTEADPRRRHYILGSVAVLRLRVELVNLFVHW